MQQAMDLIRKFMNFEQLMPILILSKVSSSTLQPCNIIFAILKKMTLFKTVFSLLKTLQNFATVLFYYTIYYIRTVFKI